MVKPKPKLKDFVPQRLNANDHTERGMRMLAQSIEKNGVIGAMTVAANGETFDGSATWETCVQTFGEDVEPIIIRSDGSRPVIHIREDLETADDPRAIELGIAANRVAEMNLSYNLDVLSEIGKDIDLSSMIYPNDHLNELLESLGKGEVVGFAEPKEEDEEEVAELLDKVDEIESRVKLGDIWQLGRHRLAAGDSTIEKNVRALLGDRFDNVGMVWSDSPYGIEVVKRKEGIRSIGGSNIAKVSDYTPIIGDNTIEPSKKSFDICKYFPNAVQIWWGSNYFDFLPPSSCWIVWDKENTGDFADAELAWTNHKSPVRIFKHMWNGMIKASEHGQKRVHPTQKPVKLFTWCAEKYGQPGDVVFDPFVGSGISVIGCEELNDGRTVYGFELSPEYIEVTCRRYELLTGDTAKLVGHL